jgi:hypothetical protein
MDRLPRLGHGRFISVIPGSLTRSTMPVAERSCSAATGVVSGLRILLHGRPTTFPLGYAPGLASTSSTHS